MAAPTLVSTTTPQTGAAQTLAVNMPASVGSTDLILVWMAHGGTIGAMPGSPAFTSKTTSDVQQTMAYLRGADHISNGSPSTYTFTTSVGQIISRAMASRISGAIASGDPFDATPATGTTTTSASSATLAITSTVVDTLLVNYDTKSSSDTNSTTPTGLTLQTPATNAAHQFTGALAAIGGSGNKTSTYAALRNHRNVLANIKPVTTQTVTMSGIDSTATIGSPTVTAGSVTVSPGGINSAATVGTPTVTPGSVTVSPGGINSAVTVGTPTVTPGPFTVSPGGIDSTATIGEPTVLPGTVTVSPTGIDSTALLGSPTVTPGPFTVEPSGIDATALLGTPTVVPGAFTVRPSGIGPTSDVGEPTILRQPYVTATVYDHETGNPVGAGATVQLFDADGTLLQTTVTDAGGVYIFYLPFGFTDDVFTVVRVTIGATDYQGVSEVCPVST